MATNVPHSRPSGFQQRFTESHLHDLEALVRSRMPLVVVESEEEPQAVSLIRHLGAKLQRKTFAWSVTDGLRAFEPCDQPSASLGKPLEVLAYIRNDNSGSLFLLLDFHPFIEDTTVVRFLKEIALSYERHYCTVFLLSAVLKVPRELQPFAAIFRVPLPTPEELRQIVEEAAGEWAGERGLTGVETTDKALRLLVRNLTGLTATDARRLARKAIGDDGVISASDLPEVMRAKYELLARDGVVTFEYETAQFAEVGGMARLRQWLERRRSFFLDVPQPGFDPPRGLLLLGVQGCGKSLAAKAVAGVFSVPLLRLDFGTLYNKYYGETERNLREALRTAEVLAPCVLWLDEIEKGVATGEADDGLSRRLLGTLLTWMSEKKPPVFLVATANDISRLPPELIRKGRFDEIFFVDLPNEPLRREILEIHLRKRRLDTSLVNVAELASLSEGYSGSELEQAIVSAMYAARAVERSVTQADLLAELKATRPLSVVMAEQVAALRDWARDRTVPVD